MKDKSIERLESKIRDLEKSNQELREKVDRLEESEGNEKKTRKVSRRNFLKMAGLGLGGVALSSATSASFFSVNRKVGSTQNTISDILSNGNDIEGQNIVDGGTMIWDSNSSYIPADAVNQSNLDAATLQGNMPQDIAGPNYIQNTEPSNPSDGEIWIDNGASSRDLYVYSVDRGEWLEGSGKVPFLANQRSVDFNGSEVSVNHTGTEVKNGNVQLGRGSGPSYTPDLPNTGDGAGNDNTSQDDFYGVIINPNTTIYGLHCEVKTTGDDPGKARIVRVNDSTVIETNDSLGVGDQVDFTSTLNSGTEYRIEATQVFAWSYYYGSVSQPVDVDAFDVVAGVSSGGNRQADMSYVWKDITPTVDVKSGEAVISWNNIPAGISSWNRLNWQAELNEGSTSFDIEINDGSGWSNYSSGVTPPASISDINTGTDIRLRATLSRSIRGDNSPTLNYVARRAER
ncbi:MAG: hypothetical protein ACI9LV_000727 [Candidatus Nanohaloarchaea archaeon]|jgi:hypothetical protein